ncbi:hypothetical protein RR11_2781 [Ruegeria sp. R11]|nr:hypothetical protein RR11_2781 [Ruegeria sp. R11]
MFFHVHISHASKCSDLIPLFAARPRVNRLQLEAIGNRRPVACPVPFCPQICWWR